MLATAEPRTATRWSRLDVVGVFVVALVVRLGSVLLSAGGLSGNFGYDPGVYYTSAVALLHGRTPYVDFVLLHPPGIMIALTPFAMLGDLTSDHVGFMVATVAFAGLGATNAALVSVIGRRSGLGRVAAVVGGLFYAVWRGGAGAELTTRLEPLGTAAFLIALVLMLSGTGRGRSFAAGAALGFAASVKIWWIVPAVVVLIWRLRRTERRELVACLAGLAAAAILVDGPFLIAARAAMWRMVVHDQLGRPFVTSPLRRLSDLASLPSVAPGLHGRPEVVVLVLVSALAVVTASTAWRAAPVGRLFVVTAVAQVAVLATAPSFFGFYAGYPAAALSLVVAAAAHAARPRRHTATAVVALAASVTVVSALRFGTAGPSRFPATSLRPAIASARCVMADSPMALIELNVLSRDLTNGCPNWVDVTGRTYDVDAPPADAPSARVDNARWQRDLRRYLFSGDAVLVIRADSGIAPPLWSAIAALPVAGSSGGVVVHAVPRSEHTTVPASASARVIPRRGVATGGRSR